jgi:hypothetical protein
MIRYFHHFLKDEPVQTPLFDYTVIFEIRYKDQHFRIASIFESQDDPLKERKKAMSVYGETQKILQFLTNNGFFDGTTMEYTAEVYSRIGNDEIKLLGNGNDEDVQNLKLEFETLRLYGFIPDGESTMTLTGPMGEEVIILLTDLGL